MSVDERSGDDENSQAEAVILEIPPTGDLEQGRIPFVIADRFRPFCLYFELLPFFVTRHITFHPAERSGDDENSQAEAVILEIPPTGDLEQDVTDKGETHPARSLSSAGESSSKAIDESRDRRRQE
jgi:hypothetical protein